MKKCCAYCVYIERKKWKTENGRHVFGQCDIGCMAINVRHFNERLFKEWNCKSFKAKTLEEITAETLAGKWDKCQNHS